MEKVFVGVGSNSDRETNIKNGIGLLEQRFGKLELSPVYESRAVGFDGDDFYNLVIGFYTELEPGELVEELHRVEDQCNRNRNDPRFSSRTLDLDLLLYGNRVIEAGKLRLPRPEITRYAFVLKPLADIAGDSVHPVHGRTFTGLWNDFQDPEQVLWQVELDLT